MSESSESQFGRAVITEAKRRMFDESQPRVLTCLSTLNDEQIWHRANAQSNTVGNLVLHLCGNVRQWIVHGLGGEADHRQRDAEFAERGPIPAATLIGQFNQTLADARATLDRLDPSTLLAIHKTQGFDESGLSMIMHVVEHLSYHTGQITTMTKALTARDMGYYAGQDLNATP